MLASIAAKASTVSVTRQRQSVTAPAGRVAGSFGTQSACRGFAPGAESLGALVAVQQQAAHAESEADGQALEAVVQVRPHADGVAGELDGGERRQQFLEEHPPLEAGQVGAEAEVLGNAK